MIELAPDALRGSYPPLVTPLRDGEVDYEAYAQLVEMQVREGSHGVVVNGTTGEPTTLTLRERTRLVATAVKAAAHRIPVVAATGSHSLAETLELTAAAEEAGAQAALVMTPYFVKPPPRGLVEYYLEVGRRSRLPVLIYHIPGRTALEMKRLGLLPSEEHRLPMVAATAELAERLDGVLRRARLLSAA